MDLKTKKRLGDLPEVATRKETAEYFGKHVAAIDRYVAKGHLKAIKFGNTTLILVDSIRELVNDKNSAA